LKNWSTLSSDDVTFHEVTTAFKGFMRIEVHQLQHRRFDGSLSPVLDREVLERGQVVAVLPVDLDRQEVVLIEQIRAGALAAGLGPWILECVAGMVETGESHEDVARREAVEETGCSIQGLHPVATFLSSPGGSSETVTLFCGQVDTQHAGGVHGVADEGEDIKVHVFSIEEALALLESGEIINAKTIIALQWLSLNRDRLGSIFDKL